MRLLLDTHALLWFLADDPKLSATAKAGIEAPANERWLSPISLWPVPRRISSTSRLARLGWRPERH